MGASSVTATSSEELPAEAYVAGSTVLGVFAALVLAKPSLGANESVAWWLIWTISAGSMINYRAGIGRPRLFLWSLFSPAALFATLVFLAVRGSFQASAALVFLSGVGKDVRLAMGDYLFFVGLVSVISIAAVFLFGFVRPLVVVLARVIWKAGPAGVDRATKIVTAALKLAGAVALLVRAIA